MNTKQRMTMAGLRTKFILAISFSFTAAAVKTHAAAADARAGGPRSASVASEATESTPQKNNAITGRLGLVNGDFSDLSGLAAGNDGWHGGLPKGWRGSENAYAIHSKRGATPPTCNPSALGFFRQNAGVLDRAADVALTFDVSEPWRPEAVLKAVIFDWYYYNDGPFLDRPIDSGFLKAKNHARLKFAFMWANHDWIEIHPYRRGSERKVLYPGIVTPENFHKICDHVIRSYFQHPNYWRIDRRPYFSFYDLTKLLESFGSVGATRAALDKFPILERGRAAVRRALLSQRDDGLGFQPARPPGR